MLPRLFAYLLTIQAIIFGAAFELNSENILTLYSNGLIDRSSKVIDLSYRGISSIRANTFDDFYQLEFLYLNHNNIEEIPFDLFAKIPLRFIWLQSNAISQLHRSTFKGLTGLEQINLSSNNISEIDVELFQDNENLFNLVLSDNSIQILPKQTFQPLRNLRFLNLDNNRLESFDFLMAPHYQISRITVAHNQLTDIVNHKYFSGFYPNLQQMSLYGNQFSCLRLRTIIDDFMAMTILVEDANLSSGITGGKVYGIPCIHQEGEPGDDFTEKLQNNDYLNGVLDELRTQIGDLQKSAAVDRAEIELIRGLYDDLTKKNQELRDDFNAVLEAAETLETEFVELYGKMTVLRVNYLNLTETIHQNQQETEGRFEAQQISIDELDGEIGAINVNTAAIQLQVEQQKGDIQEITANITALQGCCSARSVFAP